MEAWIDFAKGPLFGITFLVMILGLARHVLIQVHLLATRKGRRLARVSWGDALKDSLTWVLPVRHVVPRIDLFSLASFLMHIGLLIVPLLLIDHIVLWEGFLGVDLPAIGRGAADVLTLMTLACTLVLFACRLFVHRRRVMSGWMDYILLLIVLLPLASGYMASHPGTNPFPWSAMMLTHLLSAEALFVALPFTKLSHVVLFFFDRISAVHWQLRPGAGDLVAESLLPAEAVTT